MRLCSSSAKPQFSPLLFISQNPNPPKFFSKIAVKSLSPPPPPPPPPLIKLPPSSSSSKQSTPSVKETLLSLQSESDSEDDEEEKEKGDNKKTRGGVGSDGILVIRRPMIDSPAAASSSSLASSMQESKDGQDASQMSSSGSTIDRRLSEFAKKMPIFEPKRTEGGTEKPLKVNLDLALYRAKGLARNFQHAEAEKLLLQCISIWPEDGRAYVALGKILSKQSRYAEARSVYERGSQATQGENSYIWQVYTAVC